MLDYCLYVLYRAAIAGLGALPLPLVFRLGSFGGWCAWILLSSYRRLALWNLRIAFGAEKSPGELRKIARQHFQQLGANILSGPKLARMPANEIEKHVQIQDLELLHRYLRAGRPAILLLAHLGNWELCAQLMPKFIGYVRNATVYQRLRNRRIDHHLRALRARAGVEMFEREEGFHRPIQLLRAGGAIGILCDQHAGDKGIWVPFFNKLAATTPLPALLARRTNAALVGIAFYTTGVARWRISIGPVLEPEAGDSIGSLTSRVNQIIEAQVRSAPADWFWVHDRWKTPRPNFLLNRYKRGVYLPPRREAAGLRPFRLLVRSGNWLGDAVMSIPAVQAMKKGRPDCHLTIACQEKLVPLWKKVPEVDEVVSLEEGSLPAAVRAIRRAGPFDAAVLLPNSLRSALEVWLGRVPLRAGYRGHARAWLLNITVRKRRQAERIEHQAATYLRMAHELGAKIEPAKFPLKKTFAGNPLHLALCAGAEYGPAKRWLPERFAAVAAAVSASKRTKWILFGTAADAAAGEIVATALGENCINRIGRTSLDELILELQACRLLLTNDTGTMHLAAFLGIPTVAIFGSTEPLKTAPLGENQTIIRHHVECSPCFLRECPIDFRCMKAVSVEEVTEAVLLRLRA